MSKIKRIIKRKKQLIINNFFNKKIEKCKKCGGNGVLVKHGPEWYIFCVGKHCNNHSRRYRSRMDAIKDWNIKDLELDLDIKSLKKGE